MRRRSMAIELKQQSQTSVYLDEDKIDLIKRTVCKGATNDELDLFIMACKKTGLDPFMRQIFAVKRWDSSVKREVMTMQTGIDGYRLIADRTGRYAPGRDTEFGYDENNKLLWAKAFVKKMTPDGTWHEISAIAFWDEYAQKKKDGTPTQFWATKGHIMLAKCAEALALRKTFPAELSGIYTKEEMDQQNEPETPKEGYVSCTNYQETQIKKYIEEVKGNEQKAIEYYAKKFSIDALEWRNFSTQQAGQIIEDLIQKLNSASSKEEN